MARQSLKYLVLLLTLSGFPAQLVLASPSSFFNDRANSLTDVTIDGFQVKKGEPYDEKKDPALRRGTENWEQSQGGYFVIPGVLVGIIGLFLYFNRDKSD